MPYTGLTIAFTRLPGTDRLISISVHIMCYLLLSTVFQFTLRVPFVCTERINFFDACLFSPSNVRSDFSVSNARTKDPLYFVVQLIPHDDTEYKFDPDQKTKWIYLIFFFFSRDSQWKPSTRKLRNPHWTVGETINCRRASFTAAHHPREAPLLWIKFSGRGNFIEWLPKKRRE